MMRLAYGIGRGSGWSFRKKKTKINTQNPYLENFIHDQQLGLMIRNTFSTLTALSVALWKHNFVEQWMKTLLYLSDYN